MFARLLASAAFVIVAIPAASAIFVFEGAVMDTTGPSDTPGLPSYPPIGTLADITLQIPDEPDASIANRLSAGAGIASAQIIIPGYLEGTTDFVFASDGFVGVTGLGFSNTAAATTLAGPEPDLSDRGILSFDGFFDTPLDTAPVTIGDLAAALSSNALSGRYEFGLGGGGVSVAFDSDETAAPVPAVPLPPAGLALLGGIGLLGFAGARRL
ncbi:hypothetical protein [uncultured Jannaschia sp.]|uniref:hypothetical protein n=1 Tax=uncultured Jannaschia sp. TaxID=293347 RepID=UPI002639F3F2|nr:hypothetical protein [uncultured Jannaschia sp.]